MKREREEDRRNKGGEYGPRWVWKGIRKKGREREDEGTYLGGQGRERRKPDRGREEEEEEGTNRGG